jgi:hypothetical protein
MLDLDGNDTVQDSKGAKHRCDDVELADVECRHFSLLLGQGSPVDEYESAISSGRGIFIKLK